jgi:hypothetical protein
MCCLRVLVNENSCSRRSQSTMLPFDTRRALRLLCWICLLDLRLKPPTNGNYWQKILCDSKKLSSEFYSLTVLRILMLPLLRAMKTSFPSPDLDFIELIWAPNLISLTFSALSSLSPSTSMLLSSSATKALSYYYLSSPKLKKDTCLIGQRRPSNHTSFNFSS